MTVQANRDKDGNTQTELSAIDFCRVTLDDTFRLEAFHPSKARRGGQTDSLRELNIGESSFGLQGVKNFQVEIIQQIVWHNDSHFCSIMAEYANFMIWKQ